MPLISPSWFCLLCPVPPRPGHILGAGLHRSWPDTGPVHKIRQREMAHVSLTSNQEFKAPPFKPRSLIITCFFVGGWEFSLFGRNFHWERNQNYKMEILMDHLEKKTVFVELFLSAMWCPYSPLCRSTPTVTARGYIHLIIEEAKM